MASSGKDERVGEEKKKLEEEEDDDEDMVTIWKR